MYIHMYVCVFFSAMPSVRPTTTARLRQPTRAATRYSVPFIYFDFIQIYFYAMPFLAFSPKTRRCCRRRRRRRGRRCQQSRVVFVFSPATNVPPNSEWFFSPIRLAITSVSVSVSSYVSYSGVQKCKIVNANAGKYTMCL